MYCVINIHHYDGVLITNHPQDEVVSAVETLWTQIAEYFKDYPDKLIFEGLTSSLAQLKRTGDTVYTEDMLYEYVNEMTKPLLTPSEIPAATTQTECSSFPATTQTSTKLHISSLSCRKTLPTTS